MDKYYFQSCPKIVVLSRDKSKVLLCKRKGEADYDGTFSFIGGKMETSDPTVLVGLKREKDEEVGEEFKIRVYPTYCVNLLFTKKDGTKMILPHYYSEHLEGNIKLSQEYSEYKWVVLDELESFKPKIPTIPEIVKKFIHLSKIMKEEEFVII